MAEPARRAGLVSQSVLPAMDFTGGGKILPGENFAGKISPLRTVAKFSPGEIFGGTVPSFATAAEGLCFLRRAKHLPTRLSQPFLAQMYGIWCC